MKTLSKWLLNAAALLAVAHFYSGVDVTNYVAALIAALVIGLFNAILRPILVILTFPVTIITMGLFLFAINALLFWAAASVLDGFHVQGFIAALIGSVLYTAAGLMINLTLDRLFAHK